MKCRSCGKDYPSHAEFCPHCGGGETNRPCSPGELSPAAKFFVGVLAFAFFSWFFWGRDRDRTVAAPAVTDSEIVWHAENTYGFQCREIVERIDAGETVLVDCVGGERLRVYPRPGKHPKIERR